MGRGCYQHGVQAKTQAGAPRAEAQVGVQTVQPKGQTQTGVQKDLSALTGASKGPSSTNWGTGAGRYRHSACASKSYAGAQNSPA